jgi:hypothetical protein
MLQGLQPNAVNCTAEVADGGGHHTHSMTFEQTTQGKQLEESIAWWIFHDLLPFYGEVRTTIRVNC